MQRVDNMLQQMMQVTQHDTTSWPWYMYQLVCASCCCANPAFHVYSLKVPTLCLLGCPLLCWLTMQAAALQLLGSLRHLRHLSLGGAELLTTTSSNPSPASAPARAAAAAAAQVASAAQAAAAAARSSRNSWASRLEAAAAAAAAARTAGAAVHAGGGGAVQGGAGQSPLVAARSLGAPLTAASSRASADGSGDANSHGLTNGQTAPLRAPAGARIADKHEKLRGSRSGDWEDLVGLRDGDDGRAARRQKRRAAAAAAVAAARAAAAAAAARAAAAAAEAVSRRTAVLAAVEKRKEVAPLTLAELAGQLGGFQLSFTSAGNDMAKVRDRVVHSMGYIFGCTLGGGAGAVGGRRAGLGGMWVGWTQRGFTFVAPARGGPVNLLSAHTHNALAAPPAPPLVICHRR